MIHKSVGDKDWYADTHLAGTFIRRRFDKCNVAMNQLFSVNVAGFSWA